MEKPRDDIPVRTNPDLMTVEEAAEQARVSSSMIYQWCDERRLTHYRLGGKGRRGKILICPRDLARFLETQKIEGR